MEGGWWEGVCVLRECFSRAIRENRVNDWERRSRRREEKEQRAVLRGWWRAAKCQRITALCLPWWWETLTFLVCVWEKKKKKKESLLSNKNQGQNQIYPTAAWHKCFHASKNAARADGVISLFAFRLPVTSKSHQLCIALKVIPRTSDRGRQIRGGSGVKMLIRHPDSGSGTDPMTWNVEKNYLLLQNWWFFPLSSDTKDLRRCWLTVCYWLLSPKPHCMSNK